MKEYVIVDNPVITPEELAEILGVSPDRLEAIRKIMSTPVRRKRPSLAGKGSAVRKKTSRAAKRSVAQK